MNRTLIAAIRCYVNKKKDDWDDYLPLVASAIRSAVNRHTGFTPNKLMLGKEINTPAEIMFPDRKTLPVSPEEYVADLQVHVEPNRLNYMIELDRLCR